MLSNEIKTVSRTDTELRVANYIVLFGGRDLTGEFFTNKTSLESSYTKSGIIHMDFEHGLDPDDVGMDRHEIIGFVDWKTSKIDDKGVFVERVLNRRAKYMSLMEDLINEGKIGTSSQAIPGKPQKTSNGEIVVWPLMRDSLTFTPAEPRMLKENTIKAAKALYEFFPHSKSLAEIVSNTNFDFKAAVEDAATLRDIEAALRDSGALKRADACLLVSRIKALAQGELVAETKAKHELEEVFRKF
jgi:phage head maturation protease